MNYLLPRALAEKVSSEKLEQLAAAIKEREAAKAVELSAAISLKAKIEGLKLVTIAKKAGEKGSIFGSVSTLELISSIEKGLSGITLGSPKISMPDITAVGEFLVDIALGSGVSAQLTVNVVADE